MNVPPALSQAEMPKMTPKAKTPTIQPGCVHTGLFNVKPSISTNIVTVLENA